MNLAAFRERFSGEIILPGDVSYEQARRVWNAMADRRPAIIARCETPDDVIEAIDFARRVELVIAVRGGGHSLSGFSTCEGGIVVDLSHMRGVRVDPTSRRAWADGGALLFQLDVAAQEHELVCPVGIVGHTGVAGLTLGGGMGRLQRMFGLTVDNLLSVDLITADGHKLHVSDGENTDLFWALRGAGANFGVATRFEFRLHRMQRTIYSGGVAFPIERSLEVAKLVREFLATHDDIQLWLAFQKDEDDGGRPVFIVGATHTGPVEVAEHDLRVFRGIGALSDWFAPKDYLAVQTMNDDYMGWGKRFYDKAGFFPDFSDELVELCAAMTESLPRDGELSFWAHGGAIKRFSDDSMAYTGRDAAVNISIDCLWTDPNEDDARLAWGRGAFAKLKPLMMTGQYVNEVVETGLNGAQIYGKAKYERLVALKRRYDPDNVFRLNQNIRP